MAHVRHGKGDPSHITCAVITVSDTRTQKTDESGRIIIEHMEGEGHKIVAYAIVPDDPSKVARTLKQTLTRVSPDAVILNGGTGISKRDSTFEAIEKLFEKTIPGFGEIFRQLSYKEIGPRAVLSRASAGLIGRSIIFSLPGSPEAVRLALSKILLPGIGHFVGELKKHL